MFNQHAKWLKVCTQIPWRLPIASLNYLLSSHVWRQDHNGFSHQDPGFLDHVANKKAEVIRIYLPPDANTLLCVTDHCLRSRDYVNVVVAGKQPAPQWLTMDAAEKHCANGLGVWEWASNDHGVDRWRVSNHAASKRDQNESGGYCRAPCSGRITKQRLFRVGDGPIEIRASACSKLAVPATNFPIWSLPSPCRNNWPHSTRRSSPTTSSRIRCRSRSRFSRLRREIQPPIRMRCLKASPIGLSRPSRRLRE